MANARITVGRMRNMDSRSGPNEECSLVWIIEKALFFFNICLQFPEIGRLCKR